MTTHKKPAPGGTGAGSSTAFVAGHDTVTPEPLKGWFALAANIKTSRNRQQKKSWNRGRR